MREVQEDRRLRGDRVETARQEPSRPAETRDYISTGKVKYVVRDFPIASIHPRAFKAAEAAHCKGSEVAEGSPASSLHKNKEGDISHVGRQHQLQKGTWGQACVIAFGRNWEETAAALRQALRDHLWELKGKTPDQLLSARYEKSRKIGVFEETA